MNDLIVDCISNTIAAVGISATIVISAAWVIKSIIISMKQRANTRTRAELYKAGPLWAYVARISGNSSAADDILQEIT